MYKALQKLLFYVKAQTAHGLHSPLVFDLYGRVLNPNLQHFEEAKFLKELELYIKNKPELNTSKLLIINDLNELTSSDIQSIVYISNPYQTKERLQKVKAILLDEKWNYLIDFFEGILLIPVPLAPRQSFYLKKM